MTGKMKKTILFAMMAAVLGFTACSKEEPAQPETTQKGMILHATVAQPEGTKATFTDNEGVWHFDFAEGDQIMVTNNDIDSYYTFTYNGIDFISTDAEPSSEPARWYAYYPSKEISFEGQTGKWEDLANVYALVGSTPYGMDVTGKDGLAITMEPKCAILKIINKKGNINIFVKNGAKTWIKGFKAGGSSFDLLMGDKDTKQPLLSTTEKGTYYIAVPAGRQISIKDGDEVLKSTGTSGLQAGKYYELAITIPTFTVTFDANGHGFAPESLSEVPYGSTITKPVDLTAGGYDFVGWYKDKGCKTLWNFDTDIVTENTTIYAGWHASPFSSLPGKFTVSEGKQVSFSRGNLTATIDASGTPTAWRFAENQYDYMGEGGANKTIGKVAGDIDLFGWSTSATTYGISTSTESLDYSGDFVDWGTAIDNKGTWRTLSVDEWLYLFNTRDASTVSGKTNARYAMATVKGNNGIILLPDIYDHPSDVAELKNINKEGAEFTDNSYDISAWQAIESAGAVFIPAAGRRAGYIVQDVGGYGTYWSSSIYVDEEVSDYLVLASYVYFHKNVFEPGMTSKCCYGYSVRLVTNVK